MGFVLIWRERDQSSLALGCVTTQREGRVYKPETQWSSPEPHLPGTLISDPEPPGP